MSAGLATLLFLQANTVFAANPSDISVFPDPFLAFGVKSYIDYSADWRSYCSPGPTNYVRWYTANDIQQSAQPGLDCAIGMVTGPTSTVPGSILLWNYGAGTLPASLPHSPLQQFFGANGSFYFTLTSNFSNYSTSTQSNPVGISIHTDPAWNGDNSVSDYSGDWQPYCTSGPTNTVRWYTADGTLRSLQGGLDCTIGMSQSIPGSILLWNYSANIIPGSLPHNPGNFFGPDGDFYFTLTNGDGTIYRYDYGWHTDTKVNRFDWTWDGSDYIFPQAPTSTPQYCVPGDTPDCNSNVMFLPGIEGSRLYKTGGIRLWESNDEGAKQLALTSDGTSVLNDIYTQDVLDKSTFSGIPVSVYDAFFSQLNNLKINGKINEWSAVPYDWRLQLDQIISNGSQSSSGISYLAATSSPYIIQELGRLAASSKTGKVTIIAHSNGGLVAKELTKIIGASVSSNFIDKIILVAVPSIGTPQAIEGILSGKDEAIPGRVSPPIARYLAQNWPMTYNLLPSSNYFTAVNDPVISFDPITLQDWVSKYGVTSISSSDGLDAFMLDTAHAQAPLPTDTDLDTPVKVNADLFNIAKQTHLSLDSWVPPPGVSLYEVAGWGKETLSGITYKKTSETKCIAFDANGNCAAYSSTITKLTFNPNHIISGDGTVVTPSALWLNNANGTRYWLNLRFTAANHAFIFESPSLIALLGNIISGSTNATPSITTSEPQFGFGPRLHFILHSPLTLGFIDANGRYAGSTATSSTINIPDVEFERYGDVQWLSLPKSLAGQIVMRGIGSGSFTLDVNEANGSETLSTASFAGIPSSTSTIATIDIDPNSSPTSNAILKVDFNGDGTIDRILQAKQGNIVLPDIIPPEVVVSVSTSTRDISVVGVDDVSPTISVIKTATTTTAIDTSGNKTSLYFQKTFNGNILTYARLTGINYGTSTIPLGASFLYVWDSTKTLVSQTVIVDNNFGIEALYDKKKDRTTFLVKKKGTLFQTVSLSGLRLVKLTANKGALNYSW